MKFFYLRQLLYKNKTEKQLENTRHWRFSLLVNLSFLSFNKKI